MPRRENTVGTSRVTYCIMKRQICVWGNQARASCEVEPRRGNSPFPNSRFLCLLFFMECVSLNDSWCSFVFWLIISPFLLPYLNLNHRLRAKHISLFRNSYKVPDARVKKRKKKIKESVRQVQMRLDAVTHADYHTKSIRYLKRYSDATGRCRLVTPSFTLVKGTSEL